VAVTRGGEEGAGGGTSEWMIPLLAPLRVPQGSNPIESAFLSFSGRFELFLSVGTVPSPLFPRHFHVAVLEMRNLSVARHSQMFGVFQFRLKQVIRVIFDSGFTVSGIDCINMYILARSRILIFFFRFKCSVYHDFHIANHFPWFGSKRIQNSLKKTQRMDNREETKNVREKGQNSGRTKRKESKTNTQ
jgi:hypothetical protein